MNKQKDIEVSFSIIMKNCFNSLLPKFARMFVSLWIYVCNYDCSHTVQPPALNQMSFERIIYFLPILGLKRKKRLF